MKTAVTILAVLLLGASVQPYDLQPSRGPGAGRTILLSESNALDLASVPTGGIEMAGYRFDAGYNRRFELSELDQVYLAGAFRYKSVSLAIGGSQFGKSALYTEKTFKTTVAWHFRKYVFGLTGSTRSYEFGGEYPRLSASTLGLGGAVRFQRLFFALAIDNLTHPTLYERAEPTEVTYALHGELIGKGNISTLVNAIFQKGETTRLALGQRIPLSAVAGLYWGISTEPLEYGGGLDIGVGSFDLSYMVSVHPTLGVTHTIGFGVGPQKARTALRGEFE